MTKGQASLALIPPSGLSPEFTAVIQTSYPPTVLGALEAARRTNGRILLYITGNEQRDPDSGEFSITTWKQRVDQFRGIDFTSYIADGTIIGHFILDEPADPTNWNGKLVSPAEIDEMARYSKEIWPTMATIVRGWPAYLKGYQYQYLDAAWAQFHVRFGSVDDFIANNVRDAKASGLALVTGLNVLAGGGRESGIPGYHADKYAMTASQLRAWGGALLAEPYFCAFFMFRYNSAYFSRPDIQAAIAELSEKAKSHPKQACRKG
jgi:hypothetical protein